MVVAALAAQAGAVLAQTPATQIQPAADTAASQADTTVGVRTLPTIEVAAPQTPRPTATSATGTKTDAPLLETPQSITVVTNEQMDARGVQTLGEALRYTAAVVPNPAGTDTRLDRIFIRGFDQSLSIYRDGTRWGGDWEGGTEPYGLERVDVLRGPSSVLYGQSGPGGLVNVLTKRPTAVPLREIELQTGSDTRQQIAADLGGPLDAAGRWRFRLTGLGRFSGTPIDSVDDHRLFVAPALAWAPSERTTLTLLSSFHHENTGYVVQYLPREGTVLPNPNGRIPRHQFLSAPELDNYDRNTYVAAYLLEHHLGSWSLRQHTRYSYVHVDQGVAYGIGFQDDLRALNRRGSRGIMKHAAWTVDNQASTVWTRGAVEQTLLLGVDYRRIVSREALGYVDAPPIDVFEPVYTPVAPITLPNPPRLTGSHIGLYAQDHVKIAGRWSVLAGGRLDWLGSRTDDPASGSRTEEDERALTGRLGLSYLSSAGLAPYASYSRSFSPIFGVDAYGRRYDPETGQQLELGVKYQPRGWNGFLTAAVFDLRRQNVRTPDPDNPVNQIQTGEQRSRGIELEGTASLARGLNVTAAYSFTDVEVTKSNGSDLGKRPAMTPKHLASIWIDYAMLGGGLSGLGVGAGLRYVGPTFGDRDNTFTAPAKTLVDAMLRYDYQRWTLALHARNLLDREYATCWSATGCNWGDRRNVTADLRYRW